MTPGRPVRTLRSRVARYLPLVLAFVLTAACQPAAPGQTGAKPETGGPKPTAEQPLLLTWSSTSATSANYQFGVKGAAVMNKYVPEVNVTVTDSSGGPENVARHRSGHAQLSHMTTDQAFLAAKAMDVYAKEPYDGIRVLLMRSTGPLYFAVRADSGVRSFKELQGKKFSPGFAGSSTQFMAKAILKTLNVEIDSYEADIGDAVNATKDGRIIGFVKSGVNPDANLLDLASVTPIHIIAPTPAELEIIRKEVPYVPIMKITVKGGTYAGMPNDVTFDNLSAGSFIGIDRSVPQDIGYKLAEATWEHWKEGIGSIKGFEDYDAIGETLSLATVPLHAGTVQYLKEIGKTVPAALIPPEYKGN